MDGPIFVYLCAAGLLGSLALGVWGCVRGYRAMRTVTAGGDGKSHRGIAQVVFAFALGWTAISVLVAVTFGPWFYAAFMGYG